MRGIAPYLGILKYQRSLTVVTADARQSSGVWVFVVGVDRKLAIVAAAMGMHGELGKCAEAGYPGLTVFGRGLRVVSHGDTVPAMVRNQMG